ncbi:hypothetical protein [Micromonospora sp. DPT]|uniref:hypothetical protein n=1 Tax=Micromonospora sp. DPT TaxID=3142975 RepID=UPI00320A7332
MSTRTSGVIRRATFEGLAGPALRVTALRQALKTLNRYRPETLAEELDVLRRQLDAQLAAGWRPVLAIGAGPVGIGASRSQR